MVENRPLLTLMSHLILVLGVLIVAFPIWITVVAASHDAVRMTQVPLPLWPGDQFLVNLKLALGRGIEGASGVPAGTMLMNTQPSHSAA